MVFCRRVGSFFAPGCVLCVSWTEWTLDLDVPVRHYDTYRVSLYRHRATAARRAANNKQHMCTEQQAVPAATKQ